MAACRAVISSGLLRVEAVERLAARRDERAALGGEAGGERGLGGAEAAAGAGALVDGVAFEGEEDFALCAHEVVQCEGVAVALWL